MDIIYIERIEMEIDLKTKDEQTVVSLSGQATINFMDNFKIKLNSLLDLKTIEFDFLKLENCDFSFIQLIYSFINSFLKNDYNQIMIKTNENN